MDRIQLAANPPPRVMGDGREYNGRWERGGARALARAAPGGDLRKATMCDWHPHPGNILRFKQLQSPRALSALLSRLTRYRRHAPHLWLNVIITICALPAAELVRGHEARFRPWPGPEKTIHLVSSRAQEFHGVASVLRYRRIS